MKMIDYINDFTSHLTEAMEIGESSKFNNTDRSFSNILICGLGGSGIGGTILNDIVSGETHIPILSSKDYSIPNFVNENTLVVASSYSGNTEETIYALQKCLDKNAEVCIITSGGKLKDIAVENKYNHIIIPGGHPPRAMFGYAFVQLFYVLHQYNIINSDFVLDFKNSIKLLKKDKGVIQNKAKKLSKNIHQNTPIIYTAKGFEGVAVRFRQQLNENSKMLGWHNVIPEMNHNELLGWRTNVENLAVIYLRNKSDFERNQIRMDINKKVISKFTNNITEIWSEGESLIENTLYHINICDWASWYISVLNNVDAIEIDVIDYLKAELAKI